MSVEAESATPTIYDVARAAGVSIASVSRVLNGRRNPSPEIRDRVQRAATELGYVPDSAARALSVRLKEVVGVVMRRPLSAGAPIPAPVLPVGMAGAWDTAGLLEPGQIDEISRHVPIVTLAGIPSPRTANVGSDNVAGMRALARHLLHDHGYTTLGYLSGYSDSPDSQARLQTLDRKSTRLNSSHVD